ncbi:proteasome assembly chaperone family protein [Arthrobacter sp. JSM 101049]|uniref:proteasome assembly chaperone family protein n=1 Tax=Arthrobacter sp. JSM 101049 TaxID=929097 RepID=UPI0035668352
MLDPLSLVRLNEEVIDDERLQGLGMLVSLTGHADAGHVSQQIRRELLGNLDSEVVAVFDVDQLVNYRERRPRVSLAGDHFAEYVAPAIELYRLTDGLGKDFLFLTGSEPDLQWERFVAAVVLLARGLNIRLTAGIGAAPLPVPHTRRIGVTVHGNRPDLGEGISTWNPSAEIPAAATHLLEMRLDKDGRDVVGYDLHIPHYLADSEYPQAAVAALEFLGAALNLGLPTDSLRESARKVEGQIAEQVAETPDIQRMVSTFEQRFDAHVPEVERRSLLLPLDEDLPDGEDLASAAEAFLSSQAAKGSPDEGGQ